MSTDPSELAWRPYAKALADRIVHPQSAWHTALRVTPRHLLIPSWWDASRDGSGEWELRVGGADEQAWLQTAYCDETLVTQVGIIHADHASPGSRVPGVPTSSSTLPSLVVQMYRHAKLYQDAQVLDVGIGSGYGAALLAARLGARNVTSIDVDPYLTKAAKRRLYDMGVRPSLGTLDATGPIPGRYDRIVAMIAVRPVPVSWLEALRPGGRLVTTLTDLRVIITATKTDDGGATGRIEWDRAAFMATRHGPGYPTQTSARDQCQAAQKLDGDESRGRYPVLDVGQAWELWTQLAITAPGIQTCHHRDSRTGNAHLFLATPDESWAYAEQGSDNQHPAVRQSGPNRLWDLLDDIRHQQMVDGYLQVYGSTATITPDGTVHLRRGRWEATIT